MIIMLIIIIIIISEFLDQMLQVSSLGFMAFQSLRLCAVLIFQFCFIYFSFFLGCKVKHTSEDIV